MALPTIKEKGTIVSDYAISLKDIEHFDQEIKRLETIRLFLGLQLEEIESILKETRFARIKACKRLEKRGEDE